MSRTATIALSMLEPALLVLILGIGLKPGSQAPDDDLRGPRHARRRDWRPSRPTTCALMKFGADINGPLQIINGVLPGIAAKAALVVRMATRA